MKFTLTVEDDSEVVDNEWGKIRIILAITILMVFTGSVILVKALPTVFIPPFGAIILGLILCGVTIVLGIVSYFLGKRAGRSD